MDNIIAIVILAIMLGLAAGYLCKAKKRGVTCIGCPNESACAKRKNETAGCGRDCAACGGCRHNSIGMPE